MIFPKNIVGPQFSKGDIVTFAFAGTELALRLPIIPLNKHNEDSVSPIKDFCNHDISTWSEDDQGNHCEQLASQSWSFEDAGSLDNIARSKLSISLVHVNRNKLANSSLLKFSTFEKLVMDGLTYSFSNNDSPEHNKSRFFAERIAQKNIDWLRIMIHFDLEKTPIPTMFIPLTQSFFVMISLEIESLHYAGRTNLYSDELLKQFEADLFEDFLSHIKIEYSPETIATIKSLKAKTPA